VVASPEQPDVDVLGRDGRPPLMAPWVRRLVVAVLVIAAGAAWLVDRRIRADETAAVDRCAAAAHAALDGAFGRVEAMVFYVRPTLESGQTGRLRRDLYALVGSTAAGATDRLAHARDLCAGTSVLAVHGELRERVDACDRLVARSIDYLDAVARDGRTAFRFATPPRRSGTACPG
jgi:hypothetical protein